MGSRGGLGAPLVLASLVPLGSRSLMLAASTPLDGMVEAAGDTHVIYDENNCKRTDKKEDRTPSDALLLYSQFC